MLDEQFEALLRRIYRDDFDKEIPQHALRAAKQYWQDYIKPTYKGVLHGEELKETPYQVPLPGLTDLPRAKDFDHGIWFMEQYIRRSDFEASNSDMF